jgi:hypothetical protein
VDFFEVVSRGAVDCCDGARIRESGEIMNTKCDTFAYYRLVTRKMFIDSFQLTIFPGISY